MKLFIKWVLPLLSGVLLILIFPKFNLSFLAWVCLLPLFRVCRNQQKIGSFLAGFFCGLIAYCGILYWIVPTCLAAEQTWFLAGGCLALLAAYLAVYLGVFSLGCHFFFRQNRNYFFACLMPAVLWVSLEYLRSHLFTGFPWMLIGYSQWANLPVIQFSEYTGVYGVSFLVVLINATIFRLFRNPQSAIRNCIVPAIIFSLSFLIYQSRNEYFNSAIRNPQSAILKVALLQGNIDQYKKWSKTYEKDILRTYEKLAALASRYQPVLIIWPETALPGDLAADAGMYNWVRQLAQNSGTSHLIGSIHQKQRRYFNSAFLVNSRGEIVGEYDKIHLVPFGEYVPFSALLSRCIKVLNELGGFQSEKKYQTLASPAGNLAVNICFEAIFPNLVRKLVKAEGEIIVNLTNDAWFLSTAAPYQHFIMNIFRAVENRRPLLRCDNTGISGYIDPLGRIKNQTKIFQTTVEMVDLTLPVKKPKTFYTRFGNVFAQTCLLVLLTVITGYFLRKKSKEAAKWLEEWLN
ncbi:MAG: apolipoprotein N-acyltransferase [Elusimicrobiota bacterium]